MEKNGKLPTSKLRQYYEQYVIARKIILPLVVLFIGYFVQCTLMNWFNGPVIEISQGKLQGAWATSRGGRKYIEFLNIPYALPPTGSRRFQPPQKALPWEGIRSAQHLGPECIGAQFLTTGRLQGQEDCLNLNIFVASVEKNDTHKVSKPTIVYFHGGGFLMGSHVIHGAKYFGDFLDECNLVVVQYRLASFGFLNSGDDVVKGNLGLKDMQLSLKWVQENIEYFPGGDKNNIVIAGESAGGVSVHLLMMSPGSKGLFHKAIAMSGVGVNFEFAMNRNNTENFFRFAKRLDCHQNQTVETLECLQNVDAERIAQLHLTDALDLFTPLHNFFLPSLENPADPEAFISKNPIEMIESGNYNKVPFLLGVNEMEGLIYVLRMIQHRGLDIKSFQQRSVWNKYMPKLLYHEDENQNPEISDQLYDHYFGKRHLGDDTEETVIRKLAHVFSDKFFFQATYNAARAHSKLTDTHLYYYTHQSPLNVLTLLQSTAPTSYIPFELEVGYGIAKRFIQSTLLGWDLINYGAGHGDDVSLLFNSHPAMEITSSSHDYEMSLSLIRVVVDFAKGLKPLQYENIEWSPVKETNSSSKVPCMRLDVAAPGQFVQCPIVDRAKFWNSLDLKSFI